MRKVDWRQRKCGQTIRKLSQKSKQEKMVAQTRVVIEKKERDFPGGAVVKNLPANAGDMGLIPGPGRSHVPRSN